MDGASRRLIKAIVLILIAAVAVGLLIFATLALVGLDWRWLGQAHCE
jgi:hypothetical protein